MYYWTKVSVEFATQKNYLDELYKVYPIIPNLRREITKEQEEEITLYFKNRNNVKLIRQLLQLPVFPIKDSYVAFLRKFPEAIEKNPATINRLAGNIYHMGLNEMFNRCTAPKETNRQIGPMFKNWIRTDPLGVKRTESLEVFLNSTENMILDQTDCKLKEFAQDYLGYVNEKGLDFLARFNNKYIIGEAKFITDIGGHQTEQFNDAINVAETPIGNKTVENDVVSIAIMDGVLYIPRNNKIFNFLKANNDIPILSALVLREFLYSI